MAPPRRLPWRDLAVIGVFSLLAVVFTWPLVLHFSTHIPGLAGDNLEYLWKMWWVQHALFDLHTTPFVQPDIYWPYGYPLAYGEITPIHTIFLLPLTRLIGEGPAYNLVILSSMPLTGWMTYRLARRWLGRSDAPAGTVTLAAFLAGCLLSVSPYRLVHLQLHLELIDTQWIVMALWGIDRWLETRAVRDAALTAVGVGLAALSTWYYGLMLAIILPIYLVAWRPGLRGLLADRRSWLAAGVGAAMVGLMCLPFAIPYLQLHQQDPTLFNVPADQASFWSASPLDYLLPNLYQPLWGAAVRRLAWPLPGDPPAEFGAASIGLVGLAMAVWGMRRVSGPQWRGLGWMAGVGLVLSFGPELHLGRLPLGLPMPVAALRLLPVMGSLRTWGRFSLCVELAVSLFAAAGLLNVLTSQRSAWSRLMVATVVIGACLFEFFDGPLPLTLPGPRPVDTWLAAQPGDFAIMQYPIIEALSGDQMWYTRYHGKKIVFGYGTYLPFVYTKRHPALLTFPAGPALDQLAAWGVRYVVVDSQATYDPSVGKVSGQPRLRHVITLDGQAVYEIGPP